MALCQKRYYPITAPKNFKSFWNFRTESKLLRGKIQHFKVESSISRFENVKNVACIRSNSVISQNYFINYNWNSIWFSHMLYSVLSSAIHNLWLFVRYWCIAFIRSPRLIFTLYQVFLAMKMSPRRLLSHVAERCAWVRILCDASWLYKAY